MVYDKVLGCSATAVLTSKKRLNKHNEPVKQAYAFQCVMGIHSYDRPSP